MKISQLRKRSNNFVKNLDRTIQRIVTDNDELEQLNKDQLQSGKLANDQNITPEYSNAYRAWKQRYNPSAYGSGVVNLFLTGRMYDNMQIRARGREYVIMSSVPYVRSLVRKYTLKIFGIAPSNRTKAQSITNKMLADEYRRQVTT